MDGYFWSWSDYPWAEAIPVFVGLLIGSWYAHQRWLLVALPAALIWWFWGAFLPPTITLPVTQTINGLTVQLSDVRNDGAKVAILANHLDIANHLELESTEVTATAGTHIQVWKTNPFFGGREHAYSLMHRAPSWARSLNIDVAFTVFPSVPSASAGLPLASKLPDTQQTSNGIHLKLSNAHWMSGKRTALAFTMEASGKVGKNIRNLRITDDAGRELDYSVNGSSWADNDQTMQIELDDLNPNSKSIQVSLYSSALMSANQIVFRFNRVPIG
jgi:hypothetical protein